MSVGRQAVGPARHFVLVIESRIEPAGRARLGSQAIKIVQDDGPRGFLGQQPIEPRQIMLARPRMSRREVSKDGMRANCKVVLDDRRVPTRARPLPKLVPGTDFHVGQSLDKGFLRVDGRKMPDVPCVNRQENDLWGEGVETRTVGQNLLTEQAVIRLVDLDSDSLAAKKEFDQLPQLKCGRPSQDGQTPGLRLMIARISRHETPQCHQRGIVEQRTDGTGRPVPRAIGVARFVQVFERTQELCETRLAARGVELQIRLQRFAIVVTVVHGNPPRSRGPN